MLLNKGLLATEDLVQGIRTVSRKSKQLNKWHSLGKYKILEQL